jgi:hypothetical protein
MLEGFKTKTFEIEKNTAVVSTSNPLLKLKSVDSSFSMLLKYNDIDELISILERAKVEFEPSTNFANRK